MGDKSRETVIGEKVPEVVVPRSRAGGKLFANGGYIGEVVNIEYPQPPNGHEFVFPSWRRSPSLTVELKLGLGDVQALRAHFGLADPNPFPKFHLFRWRKP